MAGCSWASAVVGCHLGFHSGYLRDSERAAEGAGQDDGPELDLDGRFRVVADLPIKTDHMARRPAQRAVVVPRRDCPVTGLAAMMKPAARHQPGREASDGSGDEIHDRSSGELL